MKEHKLPDINESDPFDKVYAASSTECTGLITVPPETEDELENYKDVYEFEISLDDIK